MLECRLCGEYVRGEAEQTAVRCPRCREPLFERPGGPEIAGPEGPPPGRGLCALHPGNVALGACKRCGTFFCAACRTRWRDRVLCLGCVERLVGDEEARPEEQLAHNRQAVLGLIFGLGAWVLVALSLLPLVLAAGRQDQIAALFLASMLLVASLIPAILGLGQAAAALRVRGKRMMLATSGLVLSGCHVGIFVGAILLTLGRM